MNRMTAEQPEPLMSVVEFIEWSATQPEKPRHELIEGRIVTMQSERNAHAWAKKVAVRALDDAIDAQGLPCVAMDDGPTIVCDGHNGYIPDAVMQCGRNVEPGSVILESPVLVIEVLSASTAARDMNAKLEGYFRLPSVHHYLLIDIERKRVTHYRRQAEGLAAMFYMPGSSIDMEPPGIVIEVDALLRPIPDIGAVEA